MPDITKIKIGNERERSYKNFPANREFKKRAEDDNPGGWPSDLPIPGEGGYGYTTTEVTNEAELTCKRPEADFCLSPDVEYPDELIIGESYEVTVNGVTGTYECFDLEGELVLCPYDIFSPEWGEPGTWLIQTWADDGKNWIRAGMNLRPGETATFVISSIEMSVYNEDLYIHDWWSDDVEYPDGLIIGESYEVTVNGVTGTYECFDEDESPTLGYPYDILESGEPGKWNIYAWVNDGKNYINAGMNLRPGEIATFVVKHVVHEDHRIDAKYLPEGGVGYTEMEFVPLVCMAGEENETTLGDYRQQDGNGKYPFEIQAYDVDYGDHIECQMYLYMDDYNDHHVIIKDSTGRTLIDKPDFPTDDENPIPVEGMKLKVGEHYTVILDDVTYSGYENENIHKIDEKYLPEAGGGGGMLVNFVYNYDEAEGAEYITSDKTQDEIISAMQSGIVVSGRLVDSVNGKEYPLGYAVLDCREEESHYIGFGFIGNFGNVNSYTIHYVNTDEKWETDL